MRGHDQVAIVRLSNLPEDSQRQQHLLYALLQVLQMQRHSRCRGNPYLLLCEHAAALDTTTVRCCKVVTLHGVAKHAGLLSLCMTDGLACHFKQLTTAALYVFGFDGA
jgi:hypothetical protein